MAKPGKSPHLSDPYPIPVRGTTLGRDCITCALDPPRPTMPAAIPPPPMPPIGIGIIGTPPVAPAARAGSTGPPIAPSPGITELASCAGIDPDQVGGTDIAPTSRA
ncbi:hypothetical protein NIIDMKKI_14300 [Mycobacterium kansasii]|uniref:Uncharacterized protein n=1 Tax=Mycobacterium kansasii TaxID=1768 RepID=A0A7G1I717_MYCKA|nr:hypothetical protein NIIDMKKI_14300 [Mycobacterium kansasii]